MAEILPDGSMQGYSGYCPVCKGTVSMNIQGDIIGEHDCKPTVQICTANGCNEPSIGDYNGQGDYACEYHMRKWDKQFEDEYR